MYITGGIGAKHQGEAFGDAYELPNESAYAETCAGIGNALWNQRMHLLTGDGKYADVLEQVTYNGFLSGINRNELAMLTGNRKRDRQPDTDQDDVDHRITADVKGQLDADEDDQRLEHIAGSDEERVDHLFGFVFCGAAGRQEERVPRRVVH